MAAETIHPEKPVEEMMKNLKIDPSLSACDANMPAAKDGIVSDAISCISSGDATSSIKESDVDREGLMVDQGMYYPASNYYGYYYPGMVTSYTEWDDQGYYLGTDGMEFQHPAIQADNGSVVYYMPGLQPGYNPYNPYVPGAMIGVDGQYMGQQPYLSSPMVSQPLVSPGYFPPSIAYGQEFVPAYQWDSSHLFGGGIHGSGFAGDSTIPPPKPTFAKSTPPKSNTLLDMKGSSPALEVSPGPVVHNQSLKPVNKAPAVLSKGCFPVAKIPYNSNQGKSGILYPNSHINSKENGQGWVGTEKLRTRYKANGVGDFELLNEQNHGPRTNNSKNMWVPGVGPNGVLVGASDEKISKLTDAVSRDEYNLLDFPTKYDHALFFVIKSYSEDDIHKSIKYNVWASTPNGNKKLDNAFQVAQEKMREKGTKCPVFLFFSVNASGQFCGVAEMIGRVDFNKNMDFWQQDKWNGFFPVKWHIIKDVPNPQFRHIILENNDNKPVTNSRDTQEVKCSQGNEMLNIFKNFSSKTSILDDFGFYENRQKAMQDKRNKPPTPYLERFPPKNNEVAQIPKNDLEPPASTLQTTEVGEAKKNSVEPLTGIEVKE